ncbi:MAG: NnrS family protein [Pelagimonas sp.]
MAQALAAFFSSGFRPMFLSAALWAALSMSLWILYWTGSTNWEPSWPALDWHVHGLLFGYGSAVLCGFLFTAIPNWTNRPPVAGPPLAALWLLWVTGRVATASALPWALTLGLDVGFLLLVCLLAARDILAAGNRRNLPVIAMVALFAVANTLFHLDIFTESPASSGNGTRMGIALLIILISLIGGRIIPIFTTNWLKQRNATKLPVQFNRNDGAVLAASALTLILWTLTPNSQTTGSALGIVGLAHLWRLCRWQGHRTGSEPLILALHVAYLFVPLGFLLTALAAFDLMTPMAGQHAWTAGALGGMTLIVMTRASLGHSGRPLKASHLDTTFLSLIGLAAGTRILSALDVWSEPLLHLSATLWIVGFTLFVLRFGKGMFQPRPTAA